MKYFSCLFFGLVLLSLLAACSTVNGKDRARVHCPACGAEVDAVYQKHF